MCCKYLVNLQHDCIVAVAVVSQVVVHVVDWVLHTWSLMPHTTNWVVDNAKEPCLLPLLPLIIMLLQILLLLMFRCCCCWPWISASHHPVAENAVPAAVEPSLLPLIPCRWRCCCCWCWTWHPISSYCCRCYCCWCWTSRPTPDHVVAVAVVVLASNIS